MKYRDICDILAAAGVPEPHAEAALLIEHYFGISAAALPLHRDDDLSSPELERALELRRNRTPLQYILGSWGFYGREFDVNPGVLIPRPDTEVIVEAAIRRLPTGGRFVDLGCGSGCISVTILSARPDVTGIALDISESALRLTEQNAVKLGVADRLCVRAGDFTAETTWRELRELAPSGVDAVISNPPYIPTGELAGLAPELSFEPVTALDGGADGLAPYRAIIPRAVALLAPGGSMIFECGAGQTPSLAALGAEQGLSAEVLWDLGGRDRGVVLG